jgi:hypothetical protein
MVGPQVVAGIRDILAMVAARPFSSGWHHIDNGILSVACLHRSTRSNRMLQARSHWFTLALKTRSAPMSSGCSIPSSPASSARAR